MKRYSDPLENPELKRLQLFIYLTPVVGFFPALWTLYRGKGDRRAQTASRLAVTLGLIWVGSQILLVTGVKSFQPLEFSLLLTSSLLTSSYFLVTFWLMVRLWKRQSLKVPGVSHLGDRLP